MVHSLRQVDTRQVQLQDTSAQRFIMGSAGKLSGNVIAWSAPATGKEQRKNFFFQNANYVRPVFAAG